MEHSRNYGITENPEDYINKFNEFLNNNKDKIEAIKIIATKPSDLTRKDLKELLLLLDRENFTLRNLETAIKKEMNTNQDMVLDIITLIRNRLTGSPLIPVEKRIDEVMKKVKENHKNELTKQQEKWLDRISEHMKKEYILNQSTFEAEAFKIAGGFNNINKQFGLKLQDYIDEINEYLWA